MKKAVVSIILNPLQQILLLKRAPEHTLFPNQWCMPGGKVDEGEDPEDSAFRETLEETGVKMHIFQDTNHRMADKHYMIHVFVCLEAVNDSQVTEEFPNREHVEYGWFNLDELPEGVTPLLSKYVQLFMNRR